MAGESGHIPTAAKFMDIDCRLNFHCETRCQDTAQVSVGDLSKYLWLNNRPLAGP